MGEEAGQGATPLGAPIIAVTVFRDGARVVRSGAAELSPGLRPVLIEALPAAADPASVRIGVRGEGVALLEVQARRRYGADPGRDEVLRLGRQGGAWRDPKRRHRLRDDRAEPPGGSRADHRARPHPGLVRR